MSAPSSKEFPKCPPDPSLLLTFSFLIAYVTESLQNRHIVLQLRNRAKVPLFSPWISLLILRTVSLDEPAGDVELLAAHPGFVQFSIL